MKFVQNSGQQQQQQLKRVSVAVSMLGGRLAWSVHMHEPMLPLLLCGISTGPASWHVRHSQHVSVAHLSCPLFQLLSWAANEFLKNGHKCKHCAYFAKGKLVINICPLQQRKWKFNFQLSIPLLCHKSLPNM